MVTHSCENTTDHSTVHLKKVNVGVRVLLSSFGCVWLSVTPWTAARQAPLSMGFSRQGSLSGLPYPPPGGLPDPGSNLRLLRPLHCPVTTSATWKVQNSCGMQTVSKKQTSKDAGEPTKQHAKIEEK